MKPERLAPIMGGALLGGAVYGWWGMAAGVVVALCALAAHDRDPENPERRP